MEKMRTITERNWPSISLLYSLDTPSAKHKIYSAASPLVHSRKNYFPDKKLERNTGKFVISSDAPLKLLWDSLVFLVVIAQCFFIPLLICYQETERHFLSLVYASEAVFLVDICLVFNTAVYHNGDLVRSRLRIALIYCKNKKLLLDLLAMVPFHLMFPATNFSRHNLVNHRAEAEFYIKLLWLLKLLRAYRLQESYKRLESHFGSVLTAGLQVQKFLFIALLTAHWLSCLQRVSFVFALQGHGELWTTAFKGIWRSYLNDFYFVLVTMCSVGYGEITPVTNSEKIVSIIEMISACGLFGFLIGSFESIISKYNAETSYYKTALLQLKFYMKKIKLSSEVRCRATQHIHYLSETQNYMKVQEEDILATLSPPLKEEIFNSTRGFLISKFIVFSKYAINCLKLIGKLMRIEVYSPNDIVFQEDQFGDKMYFIQIGKIEIFNSTSGTVFRDLSQNKFFGEIGFYLETPRTASAKCLIFTELLTINRYTLKGILDSRPREKSITEQLIKTCKAYDLSVLGIRCFLCRKVGHVARSCEYYQFKIDKAEMLKKTNLLKYQPQKPIHLANHAMSPRRNPNLLEEFAYQNVMGIGRDAPKITPSLRKKIRDLKEKHEENARKLSEREKNLREDSESSQGADEHCASPLPIECQFTKKFLHSKSMKSSEPESPNTPESVLLSPPLLPTQIVSPFAFDLRKAI